MVKPSSKHTYMIRTANNDRKKVSLKTLYKLVYNRPYSKDSIENLENEEWKEIEETE